MSAGYSAHPILCGRHLDIRRDGRSVGNLIAPLPEITSDQWSLAIAEPTLRISLYPTKEAALRALGINDERRAG